MAKNKDVFTTGEVATFCGVTHRTAVNWVNNGRLKAHKLPGNRGDNRITKEDLVAFMTLNHIPLPEDLANQKADDIDNNVILVVDDDVSMAKSIARVLRGPGINILMAHDGFEAGFLYSEYRPCLMTLDLQMPKLDGFSVLKSLAGRKKGKILVISAMDKTYLETAIELGADGALSKPYNNEGLINKVNTLLL